MKKHDLFVNEKLEILKTINYNEDGYAVDSKGQLHVDTNINKNMRIIQCDSNEELTGNEIRFDYKVLGDINYIIFQARVYDEINELEYDLEYKLIPLRNAIEEVENIIFDSLKWINKSGRVYFDTSGIMISELENIIENKKNLDKKIIKVKFSDLLIRTQKMIQSFKQFIDPFSKGDKVIDDLSGQELASDMSEVIESIEGLSDTIEYTNCNSRMDIEENHSLKP